MKEFIVEADVKNLDAVHGFILDSIAGYNCPESIKFQLELAIEEIYVNIAYYAYPNTIGITTLRTEVLMEEKGPLLIVDILDQGTPYNPLEQADPELDLSINERDPGGLGIYMVKNSMDALAYRYEGESNVFTVQKYLCN